MIIEYFFVLSLFLDDQHAMIIGANITHNEWLGCGSGNSHVFTWCIMAYKMPANMGMQCFAGKTSEKLLGRLKCR